MKIKTMANAYLVMALLLGALVPVMLDFGSNMGTVEFLLVIYLVATASSLIFVFATGKQGKLIGYLRNRSDLAKIAGIGLLNYAFFEYGIAFAEHFISASLATAVYRSYPIMMLLFLPYLLRERVTKYQAAALSLGFIGLLIALTGGSISTLAGSNSGIVLFMVMIALMSALASVLAKKYTFDISSGMFIFALVNTVFFGILYAASGFPMAPINANDLVAIFYVGIVYNVFTGIMYYSALRMLKTTFVTNIYFLSPFITFIFAGMLLGEPIVPYYLVIAAFVSAGILIQMLDKKGGSYAPDTKSKHRMVIFDVTSAFVNSGEETIIAPIKNGGRVLAVKVGGEHAPKVNSFIDANSGRYEAKLYTDGHPLVKPGEAEFVRDIMGAAPGEIVFMCAGAPGRGETAVESLLDSIKASSHD